MKELDEQKLIIDDIRAQSSDAVAFKAGGVMTTTGRADLYIAVPGWRSLWLEVKVENWPKRGNVIMVNLTALQRKFIRDLQKAGKHAGWAVVVRHPATQNRHMFIGTHPDTTNITPNDPMSTIRLRRGGQWSLDFIMRLSERE